MGGNIGIGNIVTINDIRSLNDAADNEITRRGGTLPDSIPMAGAAGDSIVTGKVYRWYTDLEELGETIEDEQPTAGIAIKTTNYEDGIAKLKTLMNEAVVD